MLGFEIITVESQVPPNTLSQMVNLTQSLVGEAVYCETLTSVDDFLVAGDVQLVFTAFAMVNEPDTISFSPGGDQANLTFVDDDGMPMVKLFNSLRFHLHQAIANVIIINIVCFFSICCYVGDTELLH